MTPIERISEKSHFLSALGLSSTANLLDVRRAYKQLARKNHPDHGNGSTEEMCRITEAYNFLRENAEELGITAPAPAARVTSVRARPSVKPTETVFSDDVIKECKTHFSDESRYAQHVATKLHRIGRNLMYIVADAPANGANDVVVATGELVDSRRTMPQVVTVDSKDMHDGVYDVPEDICDEVFPGARSVKIRFAN